MEIVGMLAGGIAHDFNNVLCGITGSLSLLTRVVDRARVRALGTAIRQDQRAGQFAPISGIKPVGRMRIVGRYRGVRR